MIIGATGGSQTLAGSSARGVKMGSQLSQSEQQQVQELRRRDQEVRQHEAAHMAAAGGAARGGARFTYTKGPDNRMYATGGEVSIDVSPGGTPEETIRKMEAVKRAAMAPANPSSTDRAVYAKATQQEMQARQEQSSGQSTGADETGPGQQFDVRT